MLAVKKQRTSGTYGKETGFGNAQKDTRDDKTGVVCDEAGEGDYDTPGEHDDWEPHGLRVG